MNTEEARYALNKQIDTVSDSIATDYGSIELNEQQLIELKAFLISMAQKTINKGNE